MMGRWAVIGAAGFVARRHIEAIRHHGGEVVAAVDPSDVAGHLDALAPGCRYFRDIAQLAAWSMAQRDKLDGIAICTPNDLHAGQAMIAAGLARNVVVEKPAALTVADLETVQWSTEALGPAVHPVLQMRLHPAVRAMVAAGTTSTADMDLVLEYHAPRGSWYAASWKGDPRRSGGLAFNLAIHALDALALAWGPLVRVDRVLRGPNSIEATFRLERARVSAYISTGGERPIRTIRSMAPDGPTWDLSDGIDLHREWYGEMLSGRAPTLDDARAGIEIAEAIRGAL